MRSHPLFPGVAMHRLLAALMFLALPAASLAQEKSPKPLEWKRIHWLGDLNWRCAMECHCAAFSPDDKVLAIGGTWHVGLWEAATGKPITRYDRSGCGYFWSVAWAPNGDL